MSDVIFALSAAKFKPSAKSGCPIYRRGQYRVIRSDTLASALHSLEQAAPEFTKRFKVPQRWRNSSLIWRALMRPRELHRKLPSQQLGTLFLRASFYRSNVGEKRKMRTSRANQYRTVMYNRLYLSVDRIKILSVLIYHTVTERKILLREKLFKILLDINLKIILLKIQTDC